MFRTWLTGTGLLLALLLFLGVNILGNHLLSSARVDLTENELYTLSAGTHNILANLQEPISLRFYLSQELATSLTGVTSYTVRVREMLEEYARIANGNIRLQIIDPEPFSEEEDQAVAQGLKGVPLEDGLNTFYFGVAGSGATDEQEVIAFFQPDREEFLEYDLSQLVQQLSNPKAVTVGLLSSLPLQGDFRSAMMGGGGGSDPLMIYSQMEQLFTLKNLEETMTQVPEDIDILMLVHPKALSATTRYAIDQFVLGGGRAIIFVDPHAEADASGQVPGNPMAALQAKKDSNLPELFAAWGVEMRPGKVAADIVMAKKVRANSQGRVVVVDYPIWMDISPAQMSQEDIVTAKLDGLSFGSAGILVAKEGAESTFTPLVQTTDQAMAIEASRISFMVDPSSLLKDYKAEGQFTLAARITGKTKSAFPDGPPASPETDEKEAESQEKPAHLAQAKDDINLIVVADTDLLQDDFWVQVQSFLGNRIAIPTAANGSFITNALDNLGGSNDLISVRNRGSANRPFTRVQAIQREAEQRFREKEQQLQQRLKETERKLGELQMAKQEGGALILSPEQTQAIEGFRLEKIRIRKELRDVQHSLQKDIERLGTWLKFFNIGLMPLLISLGGIFMGIRRLRRRTRKMTVATT